MPFSIFRLQTLTAANIVGFILGTALFAMFLMLTLYMQQVLGLSPLETGVGYLAVAGTAIIWANVAAAAVTRVGVKPALVFGMALMTVGLLYFTQVSRRRLVLDGSLPGLPHHRARDAVRVRADHDRGRRRDEAAGGRARVGAHQHVAADRRRGRHRDPLDDRGHDDRRRLATGTQQPVALTDGFQAAFWAGAAISFAGVLVSLFLVRGRDLQYQEAGAASSRRSSRRG